VSRTTRQLWIVGVALVLWALWGEPASWALVAAYLGAWLLFNWGGWRRIEPPAVRWPVAAMVIVLVLAGPALRLLERGRTLAIEEGIYGVEEEIGDRLRLERLPALAPPVVVAHQPQTFYVHAPDAEKVGLSFGGEAMSGVSLGHGVFRVAYNPREHGPPKGPARIDVDGAVVERAVSVVTHHAHPRWWASDPDRGIAVTVSEETDEVIVVDRSGGVKRVPVGDGPTDVVLVDGLALVSHRFEARLAVVDPVKAAVVDERPWPRFAARIAAGDGLLAASIVGEEPGVAVASGDGDRWFVPLDATPDWIAVVDAERLVVALLESRSLLQLRRTEDGWRRDGQLFLGRPVVTAGHDRSLRRWYVATTGYRSDGGMPEGNHFVQDQILTVDLERWAIVDQLLTARGGPLQEDPGAVASGGSPMGITVVDQGLLVAMAGTDEVWRVRPGSPGPDVVHDARRDGSGLHAPHGVADLGRGHWAVSAPSSGMVGVFDGDDEPVALHRLAPEESALDREALLRRRGERAFYESTTTGLSCQSCHLHAGEDKSAHDITSKGKEREMLKATLSTRGVAGTAPYLRNGSFPRIADLVDVDRFPHRRKMADRGAALDAYVKGLALPLNPRALVDGEQERDLDRERRGHDAFVKARCDLCHAPPAFTNLSRHPLRTLFPKRGESVEASRVVDTPSLLGVWQSAPYLIDGRAATLAAVLRDHNTHNRHGDSAALSDEELADLVYFLEGL